AGYVLLGSVGVVETVWIGAALNLAIAAVVWIGRRWAEEPVEGPVASRVSEPALPARPPYVRRVLICFTLAGVAALSYEVIWTRALPFFIGTSTYAFGAMLTPFLTGLALGSLLFARLSDRRANGLALLGALQIGIGVYGILTITILGRLFYGLDAW